MKLKNLIKIIDILSDQRYHTGESIGQSLSISRTAVWKAMKQFQELGLTLNTHPRHGYQLTQSLCLLNKQLITHYLQAPAQDTLQALHVLDTVDSTNDFLLSDKHNCAACLAEQQTQGHGRQGKDWHSPFASQIALSLSWDCTELLHPLTGLSLAIAPAIVSCLRAFGALQASLKWPNDIVVNNAKLAGFLVQVHSEANSHNKLIIGLGVNTDLPLLDDDMQSVNQAWTSLQQLTGAPTDRNHLAAELINALISSLRHIQEHGIEQPLKAWRSFDSLVNQTVSLDHHGKTVIGRSHGISDRGGLLLEDEQGKMHEFLSGEVKTIRLQTT